MADAAFIGVDWGTSNARFLLSDAEGGLIAAKSGPGLATLASPDAFEASCFDAIAGWASVPVIMAGMVGANIGWRPAPYVPTPASLAMIAAKALRFTARNRPFVLVPGVETRRSDGTPDLMRGEETQIIGAAITGDALVCLPGTHAFRMRGRGEVAARIDAQRLALDAAQALAEYGAVLVVVEKCQAAA